MESPSLSRQLAEIRSRLVRGDPYQAALGALRVLTGPAVNAAEGTEVLETIAAVLTICWSVDTPTPVDLLAASVPKDLRASVGTLAARNALGSLLAHPSAGAYRAMASASHWVVSSAPGDERWVGLAGWYLAEAGRVVGDPDWVGRMEQACVELDSCERRSEGRSGLARMLSTGHAELAAYYESNQRSFEAAAHMALAADYARGPEEGALPRRLADLALLETLTGDVDRGRVHATEALDHLDRVDEPKSDDFEAFKSLLAGSRALGRPETDRILNAAIALADKTKPSNELVLHLISLAERLERRGSWAEARDLWERVSVMATGLGLDGVHGLTAQLGLIRTSIEIGDEGGARHYLDRAFQLLEQWPDDAARRSVDLYGEVLSP